MIDIFIYLFYAIIIFKTLKQDNFILKSFSFFIIINIIFTLLNYYFNVENSYYFLIQSIFLYYFLFCKLYSNIETTKLNTGYVSIIFYKPKTLKQYLLSSFGLSYSSAGLVSYNKKDKTYYIYQMRYEHNNLQKLELKNKDYLNKYIIINTDIKISTLNNNFETILLNQKARQFKTLYLRFNCLRSLESVLKLSNKFKYQGEIFPCIYLLKLKLKKIL